MQFTAYVIVISFRRLLLSPIDNYRGQIVNNWKKMLEVTSLWLLFSIIEPHYNSITRLFCFYKATANKAPKWYLRNICCGLQHLWSNHTHFCEVGCLKYNEGYGRIILKLVLERRLVLKEGTEWNWLRLVSRGRKHWYYRRQAPRFCYQRVTEITP
jgi:hypothetical protein